MKTNDNLRRSIFIHLTQIKKGINNKNLNNKDLEFIHKIVFELSRHNWKIPINKRRLELYKKDLEQVGSVEDE